MQQRRRKNSGSTRLPSPRRHNWPLASITTVSLLLASLSAPAQPRPYHLPPEEVRLFATGLQEALKANNPQQVERFVLFPLRVNTGPGKFYIVSRDDFGSEYYKIFNPVVRAAILKQDMNALEQSAGDIAIGDGMVTVAGVCQDRRCAAVSPKVTTMELRPP